MKKVLSAGIALIIISCLSLSAREDIIDYTQYVTPTSAAYPSGSIDIVPVLSEGLGNVCCGFFLNNIPIMPVTGFNRNKIINGESYCSEISATGTLSEPGYLKVHLDRWEVDAEMVAGEHSGAHKYTFEKQISPQIVIDLSGNGPTVESSLEVVEKNAVSGFRKLLIDGEEKTFHFFVEFSQPMFSIRIDNDGGDGTKALLTFKPSIFPFDNCLYANIGVSEVSVEDAREAIVNDIVFTGAGQISFSLIKKSCHDAWQKYFSKIEVEGDEDLIKAFYTALYHTSVDKNLDGPGNLKRFEEGVLTERRINEMLSETGVSSMWDAPYLYNYIGKPWKAQESLQRIVKDEFIQDPNWDMAYWFIFSTMGFYPLTPECETFIFGVPMFKKVVVHTSDEGRFVISATNLNDGNRYVSHLTRNSEVYTKVYFSKADIENNVTFRFTMAPEPGANFGVGEDDLPSDSD